MRSVWQLGHRLGAIRSAPIERATEALVVTSGERARAGDTNDCPALNTTTKVHSRYCNRRSGESPPFLDCTNAASSAKKIQRKGVDCQFDDLKSNIQVSSEC
jgi:hypothetical protein